MAQHTRRPNDKAFRRIPLYGTGMPKFEPFTTAGQSINYNENEQVLEIQTEDNTTECFCGNRTPVAVYYGVSGSQVWLSYAQDPGLAARCAARIWLRKKGGGVEYKVPSDLKVENAKCCFDIPAGARDIELVGDKYFALAFRLVQN